MISVDLTLLRAPQDELRRALEQAGAALSKLEARSGAGRDFLGWLDLPLNTPDSLVDEVVQAAAQLRNVCDDVVCVGIGGSYLGGRAVIEALSPEFAPHVHYAGHHLSPSSLRRLRQSLDPQKTGLIVISKSGTTTEPAVAFRVLKKWLEDGSSETGKRIVAITDASRGALRTLAEREGYRRFVIPDDVGGRYSVFTPVGLLPIAVSGVDVKALLAGAKAAAEALLRDPSSSNPALNYAAARSVLYQGEKVVEVLSSFHPELHYVAEWYKQLFGESEGKEGKGIFPASADMTTDLHSLGQYLQQGRSNLFETMLWVGPAASKDLEVPADEADLDGLNYLAGKSLSWINEQAMLATARAHYDGRRSVIRLNLAQLDAAHLGYLLYFFQLSCGVSGYLLGVNPFDQPGVEAYKRNMFALLGKPGF